MPHRYPMLLVDRVIELNPKESVIAHKAVTANEPCYRGIADNAPLSSFAYPASLIMESFSQSAGVILNTAWPTMTDSASHVVMFGAISKFNFFHDVMPGDIMEHHVTMDYCSKDTAIISGQVLVGGQVIAEVARVTAVLRANVNPAPAPQEREY